MKLEIQDFPKDYSIAFSSIDPKDPYLHYNKGLFRLDTSLPNNTYVYIPNNLECSAQSITVLFPFTDSPLDLFISSGWKDLSDKEQFIVFFAFPSALKWDLSSKDDLATIEILNKAIDDKTHYDAQRFCAYLAGYNDGANFAFQYTIQNSASYAGLALIGNIDCSSSIKNCDNNENINCPLPVYFLSSSPYDQLTYAIEYCKRRNSTCEKTLSCSNGTLYYQPSQAKHHNYVNNQAVSYVAFQYNEFLDTGSPLIPAKVWSFLTKTIRTSGIGNGHLHPFRTLAEWNIKRHEILIDDITRHWYEYIPFGNKSRKLQRPLVIFLHGGSQTGKTSLYATEWMNVAEERDFIFVAPTGTMRDFGSTGAPHPAWNASASKHIFDDEKFIKALIEDICTRIPIDRSRIYVAGHSMGSAMAQRCALAMPEIFAAAASNSGIVAGGFMGDFDTPGVRTDVEIPAIWIQMGEHDVGGGTLESNKKAERTVRYWIKRGNLDSYENAHTYSSGRYISHTWYTSNKVPLLTFTTTLDKPHAITPEDAWHYYDCFFANYSRNESGKLCYQNKIINE